MTIAETGAVDRKYFQEIAALASQPCAQKNVDVRIRNTVRALFVGLVF